MGHQEDVERDNYARYRLSMGDAGPMRKRVAEQRQHVAVVRYFENEDLLKKFDAPATDAPLALASSPTEVQDWPADWSRFIDENAPRMAAEAMARGDSRKEAKNGIVDDIGRELKIYASVPITDQRRRLVAMVWDHVERYYRDQEAA